VSALLGGSVDININGGLSGGIQTRTSTSVNQGPRRDGSEIRSFTSVNVNDDSITIESETKVKSGGSEAQGGQNRTRIVTRFVNSHGVPRFVIRQMSKTKSDQNNFESKARFAS
jgi:hypothetical protein